MSDDGRYLVTVQTNTGRLFRISTGSRAVRGISHGGDGMTYGDGLVLDGATLYVVRN